MRKAEVFDCDWLAMELPFDCEIHPNHPRPFLRPDVKRILVAFSEPKRAMVGNDWILENYKQFDLIVTYDHALAHLPNVRIMYYGDVHCNVIPKSKDFSVNFILSTGGNAPDYPGYPIRRKLATEFGWPSIPSHLFLSSRGLTMSKEQADIIFSRAETNNYKLYKLENSRIPAFSGMFHVAIENHKDDYYFTEKIMDCFRTYTLPIYWGTDKILDLFDRDGIIYIDDPERISDIIGKLTPHDYWRRIEAIGRNFTTAEKYMNAVGRLKNLIIRDFDWG